MPIQKWSDGILLVELDNPPHFSDELQALDGRLAQDSDVHVVLNFAQVNRLNSSNISQLLKLRRKLAEAGRHLKLCSLSDGVWGVMLTTGLDKQFDFLPDVPSALASLQLDA